MTAPQALDAALQLLHKVTAIMAIRESIERKDATLQIDRWVDRHRPIDRSHDPSRRLSQILEHDVAAEREPHDAHR